MQANFNFNFSPERFTEEIKRLGTAKEVSALTEISEQTLSALKKGKSDATISTLTKIQRHFPNFDPIYVLTGIRSVTDLAEKVGQLEAELNDLKRRESAHLTAIEAMGKKAKGVAFLPKTVNLFRKSNPMHAVMQKGLKLSV